MLTQASLGLGRVGLKKLFMSEMEEVEKQWMSIIGRNDSTKQTFEVYKQLAGFGPSAKTNEGSKVDYDDMYPLFVQQFKPLLYTKGSKFSIQTQYTDQYAKMKGLQGDFARAFTQRRNLVAADVDNLGFTDTTYGMNSEVLYSTSHSMGTGGPTLSNRPATDIAFSPLALQQAFIELRKQKSARNLPMYPIGMVDIKVPADLYPQASVAIKTLKIPGSNNNDDNFNKEKFNAPTLIDYYTSTTAWFLKASNPKFHGLFWLDQVPYDIQQLPLDDELMHKWVSYESYVVGWFDAHGVWGTTGA